jgi:hypothetical protein
LLPALYSMPPTLRMTPPKCWPIRWSRTGRHGNGDAIIVANEVTLTLGRWVSPGLAAQAKGLLAPRPTMSNGQMAGPQNAAQTIGDNGLT